MKDPTRAVAVPTAEESKPYAEYAARTGKLGPDEVYASVYELMGIITRFAVDPSPRSSSVRSSSAIVRVRLGKGVKICLRLYGRFIL